eukprot:scaffold32736_cov48-Attheya_sp.AAC.3
MASTNDITMNFIHPVLTTLATKLEEPTYQSICVAHTELHNNAAAVFSSAGGGVHGHLALTMTDAEYLAIAGTTYIVPINPPREPVFTTSRMTSAENLRRHTEHSRAFKLYHDVDKALHKQLITATPEVYLQDIKDPVLGYANTTCLDIITHLRDTYGEISQEDLDANELHRYGYHLESSHSSNRRSIRTTPRRSCVCNRRRRCPVKTSDGTPSRLQPHLQNWPIYRRMPGLAQETPS